MLTEVAHTSHNVQALQQPFRSLSFGDQSTNSAQHSALKFRSYFRLGLNRSTLAVGPGCAHSRPLYIRRLTLSPRRYTTFRMAAEDQGRSSFAQEASSRNPEQDASQRSDPAEKKPQSLDDRWMAGWSRARDAPGRIAFHRSEVNANLLNNLDRFLGEEGGAEESRRVLVTLCGKTVDMPFLASKGLDVIGVEGIQTAIDEFREEHPDIPLQKQDRTAEGGFEVYAAPGLSLMRGDFFELTATSAGMFDLCLDRAALVAVHPSLREKYVAVLDRVLKPGARILLVCMNYNQEEMSGPPYSIDPAEVKRLFGHGYDIEQLASNDVLADYPRFIEKGCTALREDAHLLTRRE